MVIKRANSAVLQEWYSVNLNIVLSGSKKLSVEEAEKLVSTDTVHVVISAEDGRVLVDTVLEAKEFTTGSIGFGYNQQGLVFLQPMVQ